ncbi:DNA repair protein [uncultured Limimaricola sp.]|uniref:DNA repair protein n=1 Tax=uncultured Limimaricola sp. TaxID=2211667 RepID=UPI0030FAF473
MTQTNPSAFATRAMQMIAMMTLAIAATAAAAATIAAALGYLPWLELTARFGETSLPWAGMALQIFLTVLLVTLVFFLPSAGRVLALEHSHRHFRISMDDVARAYHVAHTADRAGVFTMSSEFDAVRERLAFLRDHPDLGHLEHDVMEVAAQMGEQSRDLADIYSDEKVSRARKFLAQRQEDAERQQERIIEALHVCREMKRWADQVELEESVVASQLAQLDDQLQTMLPELGFEAPRRAEATDAVMPDDAPKVVNMKPAAE